MALGMNYAEKYSAKVDEKFALGSFTQGIVSNEYDWVGVNAINVYTIPTVSLGNYSLSGLSRYGTPSELQNDVQTLTLTQDKAFTFTIDRKNYDDTMMVMEAGKALAREISEVVIPTVDIYRIGKIVAGAGNTYTKVSGDTAYSQFLNTQELLDEDKVPVGGRVCLATPKFINELKLDDSFTKKADMATEIAINGVIGEVDGVPVIKVPTSYFPTDVQFVIYNPIAVPAPIKLQEYRIHQNPVGVSGWLVEGRIRYDAFVLTNKADAIGVCKSK